MVEILAVHKQELEKELRERVQQFFAVNENVSPDSVSIEMKLTGSDKDRLSAIHILVKDASPC